MSDTRFALRALLRNPGFTLVAMATLALGVGANTAIFSVVKAVLLNPLPYREPDRLAAIAESNAQSARPVTVDYTTTQDLKARSKSFEAMSLYRTWRAALAGGGEPELINGMRVSYDYFDTLGVKMEIGRTFSREEDRLDRWSTVLILSHSIWMRRFGGDPHIVGRALRLNESAFTVIGVLPADFRPIRLSPSDGAREIFAPLGYELSFRDACRGCEHLRLVGRLKNGIATAAAEAELNTLMRQIALEHPGVYRPGAGVKVTSLRDLLFGGVSAAMWILAGAVGFVLLIACANVANLLLARATARSKELALRSALGASRRRLVRQWMAESAVLAMAGGLAGIALAAGLTSLAAVAAPREIPRIGEARADVTALLFGLAASLVSGALCGLGPALRASRFDLADAMKQSVIMRAGMRNALVATEIALAFVLAMGAGLLGKSFLRLMNVDPGFDPRHVLTLNTYVYGQRYDGHPETELNYYHEVLDWLRSTPGIDSAAMVSTPPFTSFDRASLQIQERPLANAAEAPGADRYSITPEYFRVMRIPLRRGRAFTNADRAGAPAVAIISESCARSLFAGEDPIGKHIQMGGRDNAKPWAAVVGVAGDVRQYGLDRAPLMAVYFPQAQNVDYSYMLVARTVGDPARMQDVVRNAFLSADKTQPVYDVVPMESYLQASLAERRFTLALLGLLGSLALALAAVGIYGVVSYTVARRTREIGVRMALGARRRDVLGLVLRQGLSLALAGVAAGFAASLALTRFLTALLFETRPEDAATTAAIAAALIFIALAASYVPAQRAAKVDPMMALRHE